MIYNFGSAILRSVGDTRRPLIYLIIAGALNVILNLFFVIVLHMDVEGVALATIISQAVSATLVVICLMRSEGGLRLTLKKLRIAGDTLKEIARDRSAGGLSGGFVLHFQRDDSVLHQRLRRDGDGGILRGGKSGGLCLRGDERLPPGGGVLLQPEPGRGGIQAHLAHRPWSVRYASRWWGF